MNTLEEKKAENIVLLDLTGIASFTDFFIICSGTSDRMLDALAQAALETARKEFQIHAQARGLASSGWITADLGDIVLHLFSPDQREYYQLEQLWQEGKVLIRLQ